jgi:hypothetical protein
VFLSESQPRIFSLFVYLFIQFIHRLVFSWKHAKIIYNDFSCHLCMIKTRKWWSFKTLNRRKRFSWLIRYESSKTIFLIINFFHLWSFHIRFNRLVFNLHSLCRVHIIEWFVQTSKRSSFLSNDLKTIMCSQIEFFEIFFTFEVFISCSTHAREDDTQQWSKIL